MSPRLLALLVALLMASIATASGLSISTEKTKPMKEEAHQPTINWGSSA